MINAAIEVEINERDLSVRVVIRCDAKIVVLSESAFTLPEKDSLSATVDGILDDFKESIYVQLNK